MDDGTIAVVMATLTEVSGIARTGVKIGIVAIIVILLIPVVSNAIKQAYNKVRPPPPPPPTVKFGKMPLLQFPQITNQAAPSYKLETISGNFPVLPTQGKVYLVKINRSRLNSPEEARKKASLLGFTNDFLEVDEQTYKFIHPKLPAEMWVNIISGGFAYKVDWTTLEGVYAGHQIPVGNAAIGESRGWFQNLNLLPSDLASGVGKVQYLLATGSTMVPIDSFYDANFTRVDLFRKDKDDMKIVTAGADTSPVNVIFSGLTGEKRIVQANYQYSLLVDNDFATYPLKTVKEAWDELTKGGGYIAKRAGDNVTIRRIFLAYYESNVPQDFMQPVFVFEGDAGFTAYIQAIRPDFMVGSAK